MATQSIATTLERLARQRIGPAGAAARLVVGATLIVLELAWREPRWQDAALGLVAMPAAALALAGLRARTSPRPLRATSPVAHAVNAAVFIALLIIPATAGAAFLFLGASMVIAAVRRTSGCEVTVISNAILGRDDQVGCMLFAPVDLAEARARRGP